MKFKTNYYKKIYDERHAMAKNVKNHFSWK